MRKSALFAPFLAITILISTISPAAFALNWEEYSDVTGHWAQSAMQKGFEDGLIEGFGDGTIRPDTAITAAQMISILTRILNASEKSDTYPVSDAWYSESFSKAIYLGLISANCNPDAPMSRQDALAMMAKAFSLIPANPDLTVLNNFKDQTSIKAENIPAIAALISSNYIVGYGGALNVNGKISRAEFLTVLYRVAQNYISDYQIGSVTEGGSVIRGDGSLSGLTLSSNIWFDCSSKRIFIMAVNAKNVILRSHALESISVSGASVVERLVIDSGSYSVNDSSFSGSEINTLQLAGRGTAEISGSNIRNIEVSGKGVNAVIGGTHDSLIVSGKGNAVVLNPEANIGSIVILGSECSVKMADGSVLTSGSINISGSGNTLGLSLSTNRSISVSGNWNSISLSLAESDLTVKGSNNVFTLGGEAKELAIVGEKNSFSLAGSIKSIDISGNDTSIEGSGSAELVNVNAVRSKISINVTELKDNSKELETKRVLDLVSSKYKGNYTLSWAKAHDYENQDKELWVNAKGYSSQTDYLIWINLSMQRVNIFKGEAGNWELIRSSIVGTGAPGTGTPVGVYTTTYKLRSGWTTKTYTVRPVVGFKENTGYAFHSRLYYPNTSKLSDSSIGFPVSHGCVRMYDEDVWYIYNNIPNKTTVVVF